MRQVDGSWALELETNDVELLFANEQIVVTGTRSQTVTLLRNSKSLQLPVAGLRGIGGNDSCDVLFVGTNGKVVRL